MYLPYGLTNVAYILVLGMHPYLLRKFLPIIVISVIKLLPLCVSESKQIEKRGGYTFDVTTVPSNFNFS